MSNLACGPRNVLLIKFNEIEGGGASFLWGVTESQFIGLCNSLSKKLNQCLYERLADARALFHKAVKQEIMLDKFLC